MNTFAYYVKVQGGFEPRPSDGLTKDALLFLAMGVKIRGTSSTENAYFEARCKAMSAWMAGKRFRYTTRPYKFKDVVKLQGTMPLHFSGAKVLTKLYKMMREHLAKRTCSHTPGALVAVQVVQMAKYFHLQRAWPGRSGLPPRHGAQQV